MSNVPLGAEKDSSAPWRDKNWICNYYFEFIDGDVTFRSDNDTLDFMLTSNSKEVEAELFASEIILSQHKFESIIPTLKLNCYEYRKSNKCNS